MILAGILRVENHIIRLEEHIIRVEQVVAKDSDKLDRHLDGDESVHRDEAEQRVTLEHRLTALEGGSKTSDSLDTKTLKIVASVIGAIITIVGTAIGVIKGQETPHG